MRHFDELELLDAYYVPTAAGEQLRHLDECVSCRGRFERLSEALRASSRRFDAELAAKPETFWTRQRRSIERAVGEAPRAQAAAARRFALAASFIVLLSGGIAVRSIVGHRATSQALKVAATGAVAPADAPLVEATDASSDPWASDELSDFHEVVQWESWSSDQKQGGS